MGVQFNDSEVMRKHEFNVQRAGSSGLVAASALLLNHRARTTCFFLHSQVSEL